ncbi:MAG: ribosomal-processing cysteine protease Prp [Eubacteriales bacterium]|nr:ribosomal-processing cysteine protease Prp [Eubacteriales bacterium]
MTRVTIEREGDWITFVRCEGHAGKAAAGENVACAAVSVLMQTCVNAMEQVAGITPVVTVDEKRALIAVRLPRTDDGRAHDAQTILRATVLGLTDISLEYPQFVKLD